MKLMLIAIILSILATIVSARPPLAKPGCSDKCKNVTIPYPFGIGSKCYYNDWYAITCNTSNTSPILDKFNLEVLDISLGSGQVTVNSPMVINCAKANTTWTSTNLGGSPYTFSSISNVFAPVHCAATSFSNGEDKIIAQCGSQCDPNGQHMSYSTLGESICLTDLPFSLSVYIVNISKSTNGTCSYVFMVNSDYLDNFDLSRPDRSVLPIARNGNYIPVSLDWNFEYISGSSSNGSNPNCEFSQDEGDYICRCPMGEGGNPYLPNGCQKDEKCAKCKGDCYVNINDLKLTQQVLCVPSQKNKARLLGVIIGLSVSIGALVLALSCFFLWRFLKRRKEIKQRKKNFKRNGGLLLQQQMASDNGVVDRTKIFTVCELDTATDHFNQNRILGQGGQGTVYKGMLTDGRIIAVKKSKKLDETQLEPFINEVAILSQINHRNVVKLLGCCLETEVPLLVYEFVPNGTLSKHIHNPSEDDFRISWKMRLQIATESAGAVAYLHSSSSTPIYHRDIKSSNILLDDKYRAKVSDFGTSRTITIDQTHLTTQVQGTFGYLDPEYFQTNQFTEKSDVYSFGVVLVELLTSKRPISPDTTKERRSLAIEFLFMMENSSLWDIVDPYILKEAKQDVLIAVANLAKDCLNLNGKQRPTMKEVAVILEGLRVSNETSTKQQTFPEWNNGAADIIEQVDVGPFTSSTFSSHHGDSSMIDV